MTRRHTILTAAGFLLLSAVLTSIITTHRAPGGTKLRVDVADMSPASAAAGPPPAPRDEAGARVSFARETNAENKQSAPARATAAQSDTAAIPSMVIRNGDASVLVDSLETAVDRVTQLARRLGGYVANTAMQAGPQQIRSATLTLKIPSARYDDALGSLGPLGKVETATTSSEDVGEEFVDVRARVANAHRLEDRLVALLATRTGKLPDVLAVERELSRVREEIERYEGRLRYLRSRVAMSTLSVTVHEALPLVGSNPSANVLGVAFKQAWRNFVSLLAGSIAALGVLIPLGALLGIIVLAARRFVPGIAGRPTGPESPAGSGTAA